MAEREMSEEEALRWLSPGWTEERYANATDEDWEVMSDELLELNIQRMVPQGHRNFAATKASIREADAAIGRAPRDMLETEHHLVKVVEDAGYEDFGFVMVRTDFTSESRWERFVGRWDELLDMQFDNALPETGLQRIQGKLVTKMMDDEVLSEMGPQNVALAFRILKEEADDEPSQVEPGLDTNMCLMADAESITSVLESDPDGRLPPFIKAVDVSYPQGGYEDYSGVFRVSVASVYLKFWPALRKAESAAEILYLRVTSGRSLRSLR
ncbi:hypothetical protein V502_00247 [Pseudogymnoascus sp. VKM F-4520 (FW-2644)]|nr:hypothetical protein V502_00247 [Pseudogymnoascus sp. VKM F-4520 (FW-2644)]